MNNKIRIQHGDGGKHTTEVIQNIFYKHFNNEILAKSEDAAVFDIQACRLAYTTDSFVVKPIFFRGGDIGKLAVCGTINDLASAGACPLYITAGFIIEEGFEMDQLDRIAQSMGETCREAGVNIVAGDTKVVEKGAADGLYINTSGIGAVHNSYNPRQADPGDEIIISGTIAEHGTVILVERNAVNLQGDFQSDCSPLSNILYDLGDDLRYVKLMRDPTRGGLATALCEIAAKQKLGILIEEDKIPIHKNINIIHDLLGTDPLYFASEGRMILVTQKGYGDRIRNKLIRNRAYRDAQIIGMFVEQSPYFVRMTTSIGGERIITLLENQMIPRIC